MLDADERRLTPDAYRPAIYKDTLAIPLYAAAASLLALLAHAVYRLATRRAADDCGQGRIKALGGQGAFACMLLRMVSSIVLAALSASTLSDNDWLGVGGCVVSVRLRFIHCRRIA